MYNSITPSAIMSVLESLLTQNTLYYNGTSSIHLGRKTRLSVYLALSERAQAQLLILYSGEHNQTCHPKTDPENSWHSKIFVELMNKQIMAVAIYRQYVFSSSYASNINVLFKQININLNFIVFLC